MKKTSIIVSLLVSVGLPPIIFYTESLVQFSTTGNLSRSYCLAIFLSSSLVIFPVTYWYRALELNKPVTTSIATIADLHLRKKSFLNTHRNLFIRVFLLSPGWPEAKLNVHSSHFTHVGDALIIGYSQSFGFLDRYIFVPWRRS